MQTSSLQLPASSLRSHNNPFVLFFLFFLVPCAPEPNRESAFRTRSTHLQWICYGLCITLLLGASTFLMSTLAGTMIQDFQSHDCLQCLNQRLHCLDAAVVTALLPPQRFDFQSLRTMGHADVVRGRHGGSCICVQAALRCGIY